MANSETAPDQADEPRRPNIAHARIRLGTTSVALASGLIGALIGSGIGLVGTVWATRASTREMRHDADSALRKDAYATFLQDAYNFESAMPDGGCGGVGADACDYQSAAQSANEQFSTLRSALIAVDLYGSPAARHAAFAIGGDVNSVSVALEKLHASGASAKAQSTLDHEVGALTVDIDTFVKAAESELT